MITFGSTQGRLGLRRGGRRGSVVLVVAVGPSCGPARARTGEHAQVRGRRAADELRHLLGRRGRRRDLARLRPRDPRDRRLPRSRIASRYVGSSAGGGSQLGRRRPAREGSAVVRRFLVGLRRRRRLARPPAWPRRCAGRPRSSGARTDDVHRVVGYSRLRRSRLLPYRSAAPRAGAPFRKSRAVADDRLGVRGKDAGRPDSGAIGPTEDAAMSARRRSATCRDLRHGAPVHPSAHPPQRFRKAAIRASAPPRRSR